jgi:hypothetical protein
MLHKSVDRIFVALASDGDLDLCSLFVKPYQILHSDSRDHSTIQVKGKNVHKEQWTEVREWLFSSESKHGDCSALLSYQRSRQYRRYVGTNALTVHYKTKPDLSLVDQGTLFPCLVRSERRC